jgi:MFS family permease
LIGRKKVIIFAKILNLLSRILYVPAAGFIGFLIADAFKASGEAFYSGSGNALIYDSLKENGEEANYHKIEAKGYYFATLFFVLASLLGGFLYPINPILPYALMIIPAIIDLINAFNYQEPILDSEKVSIRKYLSQNKQGFLHIFRSREIAIVSIYAICMTFVFSSGVWYLYQKAANEFQFPTAGVGIVIAIMYLIRALGTRFFANILNKIGERKMLPVLPLIQGIGSFLIVIPNIGIGLMGLGLRYYNDGLRQPFLTKLQNEHIESKYRATALSASALVVSLLLTITSVPFGFLIDIYGARSVIAITGFLSILIALPLSKKINQINISRQ